MNQALFVPALFPNTSTNSKSTDQEGNRSLKYGLQLGNSWNNVGLSKTRSFYTMNVKAVSEANQSETHLNNRAQVMNMVRFLRSKRSALRMPLCVQPVFRGTRTKSRGISQEGKRDTKYGLRLLSEANQSKTHLSNREQPVFRGTRTKSRGISQEGKRDTKYGLRLLSEANQSKTHLSNREQPVFRGTRKEGKRDTLNV